MTKEWYPIIDGKKCISCLKCVEFCPNNVYSIKEGKPFVKNKEACVAGCTGCEEVCPKKAITHNSNLVKKQNFTCSCGGNCTV